MFKIGFQNCNTISKNKLSILQTSLRNFDIIFLSEINKKNFSFANADVFQNHVDPEVPRIGMIAVNTVKVKALGVGIKVSQERTQTDKTAVQSFVYQVKHKDQTHFVENFYMVPDAKSDVVNSVIAHISSQAKKYQYYCCGGDFNLNWTDRKIRNLFLEFSSFSQLVTRPTRCRSYFKDGRKRFSNTTIDLFFCNSTLRPWIGPVLPIQLSDAFDHKIVSVSFKQKTTIYYRKLKKPTNHLIRPSPKEETVVEINQAISSIDDVKSQDYDSYFGEIRKILDKFLPFNKPGTTEFMIYRFPLPPEIVKEIRKKHQMEKLIVKSKLHWDNYKRQRNLVARLTQRAKKRFFDDLINRSPPEGIQEKIKFMQLGLSSNLKSDLGRIELEGLSGQDLADAMSRFYRKRACDLVSDDEIWRAGPSAPVLRPDESIPEQLDFQFPIFDDLYEFLPKNKITNSCGLSGISAKVLEFIWPSIKNTLSNIVQSQSFSFPELDMGYYQRTIPKQAIISILKDLRPLGVLDPIIKYLINRPVFKQLRNHITPLLKKRLNYSYRGTHLCIIKTFDTIFEAIEMKKPTMLVKYDFSNAFGTLHHASVMHALRQLNISDSSLSFLNGYLKNQRPAKTFVTDDHGMYVSDVISMDRGCAQGQVGADIMFVIQQLVLRELDEVVRTLYMDDLNDIIASLTARETLQLAAQNQQQLVRQSQQIGFALNDDKTTNIPFNIPNEELQNSGIKFVKESFVLGVDFLATKKGPCLSPAADKIIKRLNSKIPIIHAARSYNSFETRVTMARKLVHECIGELHLVYAYDPSTACAQFDRVRVKVNELLRATGLRYTTPCAVLDLVLGTNLEEFATHGIIMHGLKTAASDSNYFDRSDKIRSRYAYGTYMTAFVTHWNELSPKVRRTLRKKSNFNQMKEFLKRRRRLDINHDAIFKKYFWIDLRGGENIQES